MPSPISATIDAQVDALMSRFVTPDGPGAAIAVIRDGELICRKAYGLADLEWKTPLAPDCVFRICSLTKQFTAVATMMLAEAGKLEIDAPIERYLTDWPARGRRVTLRHLLNHTSGVWRHDSDQVERTLRPNPPVAEVRAMIAERDFEFEPGTKYRYNNSGYMLLGAIIEEVSGQSFWDFLESAIFEPLGMSSTGEITHTAITPRRARGYVRGRKRFHNARLDAMNWSHAAGALGSTLDDLALWDGALRDGRLISSETMEQMLADTPLADGSAYPYGFGWGTGAYLGRRLFHHTGGISGFGCQMAHLRDEALTTIVLSNLYLFPFDPVTRGLLRIGLEAPAAPAVLRDPTPDELAASAGRYEGETGALLVSPEWADLAVAGDGRMCDRADPETEFRFSDFEAGRFQRVDYVSPLWPTSTFRRTPET